MIYAGKKKPRQLLKTANWIIFREPVFYLIFDITEWNSLSWGFHNIYIIGEEKKKKSDPVPLISLSERGKAAHHWQAHLFPSLMCNLFSPAEGTQCITNSSISTNKLWASSVSGKPSELDKGCLSAQLQNTLNLTS